MLRVTDCVCNAVRLAVPQPTEGQRIRDQIEAITAVWFHELHQNEGEE